MAICRIYEVPGGSLEQYDQINQAIQEVPEGGQVHVAGSTGGTMYIVEVWESREHVERFMQERLGPELQKAQAPEPKITEFEVHNMQVVGPAG